MDPKLKKLITGALTAGLAAAIAYFTSHIAQIQPDATPVQEPIEVSQ